LLDVAAALADVVTQEFGLVGLNGIDFIARNGVPYPIEVNPRYSASMELVERAGVPSIFEVHARACQGDLPVAPAPLAHVHGKAIVFARREAVLGDTRPWLERGWFGDIPHPGERIHRNRPICTVFATGKDVATCYRQLVKRAASVYRASELSKRGAA
jgi:predicted ATP-grasp superfamily ATP-dependent carboligase